MANVKSRTRSGRMKTSNDERRAFQRTARRSYTCKDQGTNKEAVAMARANGVYGDTPETRHQKMVATMIRNLKNGEQFIADDPKCLTCGSTNMSSPRTTAITCHKCADDVKNALLSFAPSANNTSDQ